MQCTKCKNNIDDDSTFCEFCGEQACPVSRHKEAVTPTQNKTISYNSHTNNPLKKRYAKFIKKNLDAILIIIGAGILFWALMSHSKRYNYSFEASIGVMLIVTGIMLIVKKREN